MLIPQIVKKKKKKGLKNDSQQVVAEVHMGTNV